ncbi:MAG: hypothetical protein GX047_05320 [Firmicutes bacterium]|nr:hypothetical protein [Bacillota bacterium]
MSNKWDREGVSHMVSHTTDRIQSRSSRRLSNGKNPATSRQRSLVSGLVLLTLVLLAAGCGPKGYIEGTAYHPSGTALGGSELLVSVDGKTHVVVTGADGTFRISGIALGSRQIKISFYDTAAGERYEWAGAVQVGIQGAKLTVELSGALQGFNEMIQAVWRQLSGGQWESAKKNLEAIVAYDPQGDDEITCSLAWGWYYLRSGESRQRAKEHFEKALSAGKEGEARVGLAAVEAAAGGYSKAASLLEQAFALEPDLQLDYLDLTTGDLQVALASYYLKTGDDAKTVQILKQKTHGASPQGREVRDKLLLFLEG